jgi:hypothetical protein
LNEDLTLTAQIAHAWVSAKRKRIVLMASTAVNFKK